MKISRSIVLSDSSSTSAARRAGAELTSALGMNEVRAGEASIIITEAARNAVVYGKGGHLLLSAANGAGQTQLDIVAIDRGPGIPNIARALEDGFSTGSTPGTGLGAIRRMASHFDVFSNAKGTALFARVAQPGSQPQIQPALDFAGFLVPLAGEKYCGDGITWFGARDCMMFMVVDGLGHGIAAMEAADEAARVFEAHKTSSPGEILARIHDALKKTRGAAAAVAEIRPLSGLLTFAGIGNISASILSHSLGRNLVSHNGTLGHVIGRIQEFKVDWPRDGVLVMHSDGVQSRWDLSKYPGLLSRQAAVIAGVLLRDFRRERDDASVLVVKPAATA
ncbi:MAG TPA: ATP-binding SpoIIE family protein phosphatase [Candidatus Angelobacter sp.]|jgi:anti-sigma regulatory factor (Ser/Thr protein kinase)|nr:ATP-binding SpoIIE family protein phosphatase [Candidatus Angelobacter sp.]